MPAGAGSRFGQFVSEAYPSSGASSTAEPRFANFMITPRARARPRKNRLSHHYKAGPPSPEDNLSVGIAAGTQGRTYAESMERHRLSLRVARTQPHRPVDRG